MPKSHTILCNPLRQYFIIYGGAEQERDPSRQDVHALEGHHTIVSKSTNNLTMKKVVEQPSLLRFQPKRCRYRLPGQLASPFGYPASPTGRAVDTCRRIAPTSTPVFAFNIDRQLPTMAFLPGRKGGVKSTQKLHKIIPVSLLVEKCDSTLMGSRLACGGHESNSGGRTHL